MNIEIKVLNREFYQKNELLLTAPPQPVYDLPCYATPGSGAVDLRCTEDLTIMPGDVKLVGTGLAIHIQDINVIGVINCRSGLGHKRGLILGNIQGWIDSDYTNEIKISSWNRGNEFIQLQAGERIAQLAFFKIERPNWDIVSEFSSASARTGGFGSTGLK